MKFSRRYVLRLILLATIIAAIIVLMAVLPLVGFSISIVYLVAGAAFGGIAGFAVVTGITAVHLLGSHWLGTTFLRRPVTALLKRKHVRVPSIPPGEEWAVALLGVLTPGPPYFVRNYALALSGIPLRTYFWIAWPIYVLRSCLVIFIGDVGAALSTHRVVVLAGIFILKLSICAYIVFHVRRRYHALHPGRSSSLTSAPATK